MREMRALLCITALAQAFLHAPRRTIRRQTIRATASDDDEGFSIAGDEEEVSLDLVDLLRAPPDAAPNRNRSVDYFGESTSEQDQECRSLNLRGISVIGYDMDYTIVHYKWREWELLAYECTAGPRGDRLPVADLEFDKDLACRGLVIDKDRGNFLKIDRHGFVDLRSNRFSFLNTLFSVSEGVMYAQLVSKLDSGALFRDASPPFDASRVANYADLHRARAGK
ncbi:5'-nucleotidase [Aureococcus anophagefferens]|nr:5'-nucleotidase [Aureococcus anophagefferens]